MLSPPSRRPDGDHWVTPQEVEAVLGIKPPVLSRDYLPKLRQDEEKTKLKGRRFVQGPRIAELWLAKMRPPARSRPPPSNGHGTVDEDALLFAGDSSPQLERWRRVRADMAELDLAERQEELIARAIVHEGFQLIAKLWRQHGEQLQQMYGEDAARLHNETVRAICRQVVERFGESDQVEEQDGR